MNCPICNRPLRIVPEQVGVDGKGLPIYHRIAYCDYCKKRGDLDIPNNGLTGANNPNGYNRMNTGNQNPGNSSNMLQPNKNGVKKNGIGKVIAICVCALCALFFIDSLFSSDQRQAYCLQILSEALPRPPQAAGLSRYPQGGR